MADPNLLSRPLFLHGLLYEALVAAHQWFLGAVLVPSLTPMSCFSPCLNYFTLHFRPSLSTFLSLVPPSICFAYAYPVTTGRSTSNYSMCESQPINEPIIQSSTRPEKSDSASAVADCLISVASEISVEVWQKYHASVRCHVLSYHECAAWIDWNT